MGFHYADYIVFVLFLALSLSIGLYHAFRGGKQRTTEEFLMGDRKLQTFPVAISITLSFISAILVLGQPAEVYTRGTQFTMVCIGHLIGCIFVNIFVVPIFFNLKVTSSFEYLELRFGSPTAKLFGTFTMITSSMIQLGIVLYAPSVALEAVAGLPTWVSIMFSSIVAIIYTTLGGMKAVIWTDVFQGGCVLVGMLAVIIKGTLEVGGLFEVWEKNLLKGRVEFFNINPDPRIRTTFWSSVASGIFFNLAIFGVGQTTVQRYCSLQSLTKARCSLIISTCLLVLMIILATMTGMVIFAYYENIGCDPLRGGLISSPNQLLPYFVMNVLNYPGFPGLFVSILYAGALSTMSSSLNSAAAVTWQDILKKSFKHLDDSKKALITKVLVVVYGTFSIAMAFLADYLGGHVLQAANVVLGTFGGPILGMFLLGMMFKCSNEKGVVTGCACGMLVTLWIAVGSLATNQHSKTLPTTVDYCFMNNFFLQANNSSSFTSSTLSFQSVGIQNLTMGLISINSLDSAENVIVATFYRLSYLLYPVVGLLVTITVGLLVSFATRHCNEEKRRPSPLSEISTEDSKKALKCDEFLTC